MKFRVYIPTLVVAASLSSCMIAHAANDGSATPDAMIMVDAGTPDAAQPPAAPQELPGTEDLAKDLYKAITTKDWFMLAGVGLAGIILGARALLKKKWPTWEKSHYGVVLAAGISGLTAVTLALLASEPVAGSHTLLGALKLFAAATLAYVVPKKLAQGSSEPA